MSASAVLNLIAPSAPLPGQAGSDADTSAFEGLLSDALASEKSTGDTPPTRPVTRPGPGPVQETVETSVSEDEVDPAQPDNQSVEPKPPCNVNIPPVGEGADVAVTMPGSEADASLAAGTGAGFATVMALAVAQSSATQPPSTSAEQRPASIMVSAATASEPAEAVLLAAAAKASIDDAQTQPPATSDKTAATTPPVPQVQPPAPPPLKPASERTGRNTDGQTREGGDASASGETTKATTVSAPNAAVTSASTASKTPAEVTALASAIGQKTADSEPSGDLGSEGAAASLDTAKAHAEAAIAHDSNLSTLSRASIDATAQIAAQIIRKLDGRSTKFEMALTPDDLGRVDVKLEIDAEGRLAARMAFDNPAAAADLRGRADELRRQLQDAGFHVPDDAFEFAERDSGSSAFDRGSSDHNDNQRQNRAFSAASRLNAEIDVAQPPRWMSLSLSPSGVDLKV